VATVPLLAGLPVIPNRPAGSPPHPEISTIC
jgi:hypothetical protein